MKLHSRCHRMRGGNVRVGWSMRTGDLQAPVGYDKWSYGIRDTGGSIIHKSQRQDAWGGDGFGPGDVVGTAIVLGQDENSIRFFKNGKAMGQFVIAKGKRVGGQAFTELENGTYYPAVSTYLGGTCRVNFGPAFIFPPRKLPAGLRLKPISDLCPAPDVVTDLNIKLLDKDAQAALHKAAQAEAAVLCQAHDEFCQQQLAHVRQERLKRGISVQDLPPLEKASEEV
jgi:Set1/Ash2 histone methyltransferase complex subunit ASH2